MPGQEPQSRVNAMDHYLRNSPDEWWTPQKQTENTLDRRDKRNIFFQETSFVKSLESLHLWAGLRVTHLFLGHLWTLLMWSYIVGVHLLLQWNASCKVWPWLGWVALFKEYCSLETFIVNSSKQLVLFLLCLRRQRRSNVITLTVHESPTLVVRIV